jgi:hypothetical protein
LKAVVRILHDRAPLGPFLHVLGDAGDDGVAVLILLAGRLVESAPLNSDFADDPKLVEIAVVEVFELGVDFRPCVGRGEVIRRASERAEEIESDRSGGGVVVALYGGALPEFATFVGPPVITNPR